MDFIQEINESGGKVYLVGGAIRDKVINKKFKLGIKTKDFDLMVANIPITKLESILYKHGKLKEVGKAFGIITFKPSDTRFKDFDIALPRKEVSTGPGYRDFKIITDHTIPLEEDLSRRDATINAIAYQLKNMKDLLIDEIEDDRLVDYFSGLEDINNRVWRAVGDPKKRFYEDPTRILRCLRQTTNLGLTVHLNTLEALIQNADLLKNVITTGAVRLTSEVVKMLNGRFINEWIRFILTKRIGPLLGLNYNKSQILKICSAIDYAVEHKFSLESKVGILLLPMKEKAVTWIKDFDLSAASRFDKFNIPIIHTMVKYGGKLNETHILNPYNMRKWIVNVDSKKDPKAINPPSYYLLEIYESYKGEPIDDVKSLYQKHKNIILDSREIACSGNKLLEMGFRGREIGKIKGDIFELIIREKIENNEEKIMEYIKSHYSS